MKRLLFAFIMLALLVQGACAEEQAYSDGQNSDSDTDFTITPEYVANNEVFNVVVIGDSIAWGAGLKRDEKYSYLVAKWLSEELNRPVNVKVLAHTGATLCTENYDPIRPPDLYSGNPTVSQQTDIIQNPDSVDLILISGGINDIEVENIIKLDHLTNNVDKFKDIWKKSLDTIKAGFTGIYKNPVHDYKGATFSTKEVQKKCLSLETPMRLLLDRLLLECPNAKIVVTSYYPIISEESTGLAETIKALNPESQKIDDYKNLDETDGKTQLVEKSDVFHTKSKKSLSAAVNGANSGSEDNRVAFAQIDFSPENCYGADQSLLWRIGNFGGAIKTDDNMFDKRLSLLKELGWFCACDPCLTPPDYNISKNVDCDIYRRNKFVAVGHPNELGAEKYNESIIKTISETWPEWLYPGETANMIGIDVSDYQGSIDWSQVASAEYSFAFVKATEGEGWTGDAKARQQNFEANMQGASSTGMLVGAYHFARPDLGNSAADEARWFVNVAGDYIKSGYLRPVLDIEVGADALGGAALSSWVSEWMETVTSETGVEPLIYTNADYAGNYLDASLSEYDLWVAHWTYDTIRSPNTGIWDGWAFWQYSDEGRVPGIAGDVDLDLFSGSEAELSKFVISASSTGSEVAEEWNRTFGGAGDDRIGSVEITSDGGYILAGGTSSFGTIGEDAWLIKTDEAGNELWENTFGGAYKAYDGWASSVQPTKDGGFVFTEYNCGIGLWPEQPDQYDCNISVIKVDSKGCEIWREFGDMIKPTPDGGYLIKCSENYIKINSQGNEIWRKQIFPIWGCCGSNYLLPSSDDCFILILWNSSFDYDSKSYERIETYEWVLTKRDAGGNEIWTKGIDLNYTGYIYSYHALSVYPAADGGYILAGGMCHSEEKNSGNAWLVKTDSQGNEIWKGTFDGYSDVLLRPTSDGGCLACLGTCESESSDSLLIKADAEGNVAWSRRFDGWINDVQIDPNGGYILSQTKESEDIGSSSWMIRIDTHGNDVWTKAFDGGISQIRSIPNGGYILAGSTSSFGAGGSDAWLIKLVPA